MLFAALFILIYLNTSNTLIGIITGASSAGIIGMFLSPWISRRFAYKKWYYFICNIPYTAPIGLIGLVLLLSPGMKTSDQFLQMAILFLVLVHHFFSGFVALPAQEYIAACIPVQYRGRYMGLSGSISSIASMLSAAIGGWILLRYAKPMSFGYLCLLTWFLCQASYFIALTAKEIPVAKEPPKAWSRNMLNAVWENKPFIRILCCYALICLLFMPVNTFVPIYGFRKLNMDASTSAVIVMIMLIARIAFSALGGILVDKFGPKRIYPWWAVGFIAGILPLLFFKTAYAVYFAVAIQSIFWGIWGTSLNVLLTSLPKAEHRAGHYTVQLILFAVMLSIGPIWTGWILDVIGFKTLFVFAISGAIILYPLTRWAASGLSDNPKSYA